MDPFGFQTQGPINVMQGRQMPGMPSMPKTSYTGLMQSEQAKNALAAQELQRRADLAALAQQMAQMEEYQKNAGWRDMERQAGMETARGTRDTAYEGATTKLGEAKLGLRKGLATEATDIGAAKAKAQTTMSESRMKQMENLADELQTMDLDPMAGPQQLMDVLDAHGVRGDHPLRQKLLSIQDPMEFRTRVGELSKSMKNTVAQQRALAAQAAKDEAHMTRTEAEIAGRRDVANINAAAHIKAAESRGQKDQATIQADFVKARRAWQAETDPVKKAQLQAVAEGLWNDLQAYRIAGAAPSITPGTGGIDVGVNRVPAPLGGAPSGRKIIRLDAQGNRIQ